VSSVSPVRYRVASFSQGHNVRFSPVLATGEMLRPKKRYQRRRQPVIHLHYHACDRKDEPALLHRRK